MGPERLSDRGRAGRTAARRPLVESLEGRALLSTVSFAPQPQVVSEQAGAAVVALVRYDGFGSERVQVRTRDVTTTAGEDYLPVDESVTFRDGESIKFVVIPLVADGVGEGEESLEVVIDADPAAAASAPTPLPLPYPGAGVRQSAHAVDRGARPT